MSKAVERYVAFGFGVIFVIVMLLLAVKFPDPSPFQYTVFRIVLALAAGGIAAMIPGFISVTVGKWIRAGGALAVFFIVYFYSPAQLTGVKVHTEQDLEISKPLIESENPKEPLPDLTVSRQDQLTSPGILETRYGNIHIVGIEAKLPPNAVIIANEITGSNGGSLRGDEITIVAQKLANLTVDVTRPELATLPAGTVRLYVKLIENARVLAYGSAGQRGLTGDPGANGVNGPSGRNGNCGGFGAYQGAQVGGPGGDAGNGHDGLSGKDGQAGGHVEITTITSPVSTFIDVNGGLGGTGGEGGGPGKPGQGGAGGAGCTGLGGTQPSQANGHDGAFAQQGRNGLNGAAGKLGIYDLKIIHSFAPITQMLKMKKNTQLVTALATQSGG